MSWWRHSGFWLLAGICCVASAEITARVDDGIRHGVPFLAVPDRRDLVLHDDLGIRGKPHGRYQKWHLNEHGFRGPEIRREPSDDCRRVAVLGASETFGLYESPNKEYPAQLESILDATACSEVINAAVAGLNLRGIRVLWERWASRFKPRAVLIYPTPAFYLANNPPAAPGPARAVQPAPVYWPPRLLLRAKERFELPRFVRQRIVERELDELLRAAGKPFDDVPADRAAQFDSDLEALIVSIVSSGATPVLVTHATGFRGEPSVDEHDELQALRRFAPRATPRVLLAFERRTAEGVRRAAKKHGLRLVDLAALMNEHREWFADDLLHFNDEGAGVAARAMADILEPLVPGRPR